MSAVRFFLTTGSGTFDAEWRVWLDRHPGAMLAGRIIVLTVAVLIAGLVAVLVVPLLSPWLFVGIWLAVCAWGYLKQRDRQHRELLAAIRTR